MSSCSRISPQALLQGVQEMVQSLSELHYLRRRVREAEASFAKAKRLRHDGLLPDENSDRAAAEEICREPSDCCQGTKDNLKGHSS